MNSKLNTTCAKDEVNARLMNAGESTRNLKERKRTAYRCGIEESNWTD
jgi:hypothetical protein